MAKKLPRTVEEAEALARDEIRNIRHFRSNLREAVKEDRCRSALVANGEIQAAFSRAYLYADMTLELDPRLRNRAEPTQLYKDIVREIPDVVNDSRGFYERCLVNERV